VRAESDGPGLGARFTVRIPHESERAQVAAESAVVPARPANGDHHLDGMRVMIVDDDPDARAWVRKVLAARGADVTEAGDVAYALEVLERSDPQLLISDLAMPSQDGFDLVRLLRKRGFDEQRLPAMALSAVASPADRARALSAGYQLFLAKPTEPSELIKAANALVRRASGASRAS
jgi:DNA-binding response OmpR family regulator